MENRSGTSKNKVVEIRLPYPPSANRLWRAVNGRNIKSAEYRRWMTECYAAVVQAGCGRLAGAYALHVIADRPDRRRRDLGNLEKPISDALQEYGVVEDDALCQRIVMEWGAIASAAPSVLIVLRPWEALS